MALPDGRSRRNCSASAGKRDLSPPPARGPRPGRMWGTSEVFRSNPACGISLSGRRSRLPGHALRLPKSLPLPRLRKSSGATPPAGLACWADALACRVTP